MTLSRKPLGSTPLDSVVRAIMRQEGSADPNSINQYIIRHFNLYNPGHLIYTEWTGELGATRLTVMMPDGKPRDWSGWKTPEEGQSAIKALLSEYVHLHPDITIREAIFKYAPPSENDSAAYAMRLGEWTGLDVNAPLAKIMPAAADWLNGLPPSHPVNLEAQLIRSTAAAVGRLTRLLRRRR